MLCGFFSLPLVSFVSLVLALITSLFYGFFHSPSLVTLELAKKTSSPLAFGNNKQHTEQQQKTLFHYLFISCSTSKLYLLLDLMPFATAPELFYQFFPPRFTLHFANTEITQFGMIGVGVERKLNGCTESPPRDFDSRDIFILTH